MKGVQCYELFGGIALRYETLFEGGIILIMVIFMWYFSGEYIDLSLKKRCEHRIKSTVPDAK